MTEDQEFTIEDQELFEHYHFVVDKGQSLLRIDKFLMSRIENASRTKLQNATKAGNILVNDKPVKSNYKVKPGDDISIVLPDPPREIELIHQDIPIKIMYEDADIIVVNKEPGMVVHPGYGNYTGTLLNALLFHVQKSLPQGEEAQVHLVHRIDKNTSGVLLIAKNELAQSKLAKQFFNHTIDRTYIALTWGDFEEDEGTIKGHIGRSLKNRKVMTVFPDGEYGREAITHYKVLERLGYVTKIQCKLETGRTHQIRAHMRYIGHPLFNDETYGGDDLIKGTSFTKYKQFVSNCFKIIPRHALHAKSLGFIHPTTNEFVFFDSELPDDMESVISKWKHYITFSKEQ
ncbi:MAG: RluA family pseudouridine synthase [Saprospiraceae bacterium]|nr:RluA family pseudouridine synthase [Saprospiraceae bacterium]